MNNPKKKETIAKRKAEQKALLLDQLKKIPIRQIAFEKAGITRATHYRWRNEDAEFKKLADEAMLEGNELINDMGESQVISLIRDRNLSAAKLWLQHHHPAYAPKLEITTPPKPPEQLTPEQEELVTKALRFASAGRIKSYEKTNKSKSKKTKKGK